VDKYSMKDVQECISEIGQAGSAIFTTLDLTSGFWQMALDLKSQPYTAFTVPGMGQFEWKAVSMGLASAPSAFQQLVEQVVKGIDNVVVYINDLIIHSRTHEDHLRMLDAVFTHLASHDLRVNLKKCVFGSSETSYLGFWLSKEGIFPGADKLKAVKEALPPENVKQICQFLGLCNFFRGHIQNFTQIMSPLTQLTKKDSSWKRRPLPENALCAFRHLQSLLCSEPVLAYLRSDRHYALITDTSFSDENTEGGLGAILTQLDNNGKFYVIAYASRKLQKYEKNYTPFLLEMQAAIFGMETFEVNLRGRHFKLFTDHKPLEKLGKVHTKMLNRLQQIMNQFSFEIIYKQGNEMPADFLSRNAVDSIKFDLPTYARE
jgi:Reverse transcriptase (RNA-dependent DNA polymerase)/RNase H-like domain found in reverse transcriptase